MKIKKVISFEDVRRSLNGGQEEALLRKLFLVCGGEDGGSDGMQAILRGELRIVLEDATIKLVDIHGRAIPPAGFPHDVVDANWKFYHNQPEFNAQAVHARLQEMFGAEANLGTVAQFGERTDALLAEIQGNNQVSNLLHGPYFRFVIPQHQVMDHGTSLEGTFVAAAGRSYGRAFPKRTFTNYGEGELARQVQVVPGTRHDELIARMAKGPVPGIYFPTVFQGFGIEADRAMINLFPKGFLLSGGVDIATAIAAYPEVLCRDYNTPVLDCAALSWRSSLSLRFETDDGRTYFLNRDLDADDDCSGGVLFVGQS